MRGRKIAPELRSEIIAESLKAGCVISNLAKQYGISKDTIYGWRAKYNNPAAASLASKGQASHFDSTGRFIELTVNEAKLLPNLQEATLKFDNFSLVIQGQIKSSTLISMIKILEETC
jgi:transposase-like protein